MPVIIIQSLAGKKRIFVPGRRATPYQVGLYHRQIIALSLISILQYGWKLDPHRVVGAPILTEGYGTHFFEAFNLVWSRQKVGGVMAVWAKRSRVRKAKKGEKHDVFVTQTVRIDRTAIERLDKSGVLVFFDIGATGSTLSAVVPEVIALDRINRLIFASPCTSLEAIRQFVQSAQEAGILAKNLACVANEGIFGLDKNGTFLSLQLNGAITSQGNLKLSKVVYPYRRFCHIGAGGFAANCQTAYEEELKQDEKKIGKLPQFRSLEQVMEKAEVSWPDDFGRDEA